MQELKALTQEEFEDCFRQWEGCWSNCVSMGGNYFEVDRVPDIDLQSFKIIKNSFRELNCHGCIYSF